MSTLVTDDMKEATERAVEQCGGVVAVAQALGLTHPAVSNWLRTGKVPATRVLELERLCEATVTRYEMRPDVFGRR